MALFEARNAQPMSYLWGAGSSMAPSPARSAERITTRDGVTMRVRGMHSICLTAISIMTNSSAGEFAPGHGRPGIKAIWWITAIILVALSVALYFFKG